MFLYFLFHYFFSNFLKANQNFLHLQASLNEVEEQISAARRAYNSSVTDYNNAIETIDYIGPRFYTFESLVLSAGKYQFCIKAVPGGETVVTVDVDDPVPQSVGVLKGKAV